MRRFKEGSGQDRPFFQMEKSSVLNSHNKSSKNRPTTPPLPPPVKTVKFPAGQSFIGLNIHILADPPPCKQNYPESSAPWKRTSRFCACKKRFRIECGQYYDVEE